MRYIQIYRFPHMNLNNAYLPGPKNKQNFNDRIYIINIRINIFLDNKLVYMLEN